MNEVYNNIKKQVNDSENKLLEFTKKNSDSTGSVNDKIRSSEEYIELKRKFDTSFKKLQNFNKENKDFIKNNKKEYNKKIDNMDDTLINEAKKYNKFDDFIKYNENLYKDVVDKW